MDAAVTQGFAAATFVYEGKTKTEVDGKQIDTQDLFESAVGQLYAIGTTEAIAQAEAMNRYYYAQVKAGEEDRNVDEKIYAEFLVDILDQPNITRATSFVANGLDRGEIDGGQANQLLSFYGRNQTKAGKPRKATYDDSTYGVGKIMKSFQAIIIGNEFDATDVKRLRAFQFGQRFREMYITNEDAFRIQSGTDTYPTPREAQSIARIVIENLSQTYVDGGTVEEAAEADAESLESNTQVEVPTF